MLLFHGSPLGARSGHASALFNVNNISYMPKIMIFFISFLDEFNATVPTIVFHLRRISQNTTLNY